MKKQLLIIPLLIFLTGPIFSQGIASGQTGTPDDHALRIYLDCGYCDMEYFKTWFTEVDYVVERKDADVYILITGIETGSGGMEYRMMLKGSGRYSSFSDTIIFNVPADATDEITRSEILKYTQLALVPCLLKTPSKARMDLFIEDLGEGMSLKKEDDPWKNWMFRISARGSLMNQKCSKSHSASGGLYVSKVNSKVKFESNNEFGFDENRLTLYDGDSVIFSMFQSMKSYSSGNLFVRSLGNHAGIGAIATFLKSDFSNVDLRFVTGPAVEFNLYSYEDATTKQFRILYAPVYEHTDYKDTTIYNRISDYLFRHELQVKFMHVGSWGELNLTGVATSYLNNWKQFSAGVSAMANIYLGKGLSFDLSCGYSYIQNQIGLRKDTMNPEDFITNQYETQTDFSYYIMGGISFRFGSIFNNTVNPRFGP